MGYQYTEVLFWFLVLGGLGLFLYGISSISKVLKRMAGAKLQKIMTKCSSNRFVGFLTGAGFTAAIQSSGGTSALTIGMVRAGVLTTFSAAAIIIGANVGTTATAFMVSLPIAEYLSIGVFAGGLIVLLATRRKWQNIGELCFSIGCIFFALWIMAANLKTIASASWFSDLFSFLTQHIWLGLLLGAVITALLQSSSAVIGVMQSIYAAAIASSIASGTPSTITLMGVLPIVFGANVGTTVTALFSCLGGSRESKRVALFHFIYNVVGALLFMVLLYPLKGWLSTSATWSLDAKVQLALCHLVFNVVTAAIFLALLTPMVRLAEKLIPGSDKKGASIVIKELDSKVLKEFPSEGISLGKAEVVSMFGYTKMMFESIGDYLVSQSKEDGDLVHDIEASVDRIDRQMNEYLLSADKGDLTPNDVMNLTRTLRGCKDIERIGDYAENLIAFFEEGNEKKDKLSPLMKEIINKANKDALTIIDETIEVFRDDNAKKGLSIIKRRRDLNAALDHDITAYFDKMTAEKQTTSYYDLVFVDICNCYQRVYSHCSNIAKLYGTDKKYNYDSAEESKFIDMARRY